MPKRAKELQAYQIKRLTRPGMHNVGGVSGLYLKIRSESSRHWILRIMVGDRRRDIGLGGYPDVSLEQARSQAREVRQQIREGTDPVELRRAAQDRLRAANAKRITFDDAAAACHKTKAREFKNKKHADQWINSLRMHASPVIGQLPVADVELAHVVAVLEPIWQSKTETATRVRQRIEAVLSWSTVSGFRKGENPARWRGNLSHVLPKPTKVHKVRHHPALHWQEVGGFMADLRKRHGVAARALEFAILTAARSGEVRLATWNEIDVTAGVWTVPGERMKSGKEHRVPLSKPALALLKALPRMEGCDYVFPASRGGALSDMSLSAVCRRMEVDAVPHGFRSTFKDWARSVTSYADEVSELALAHVNSDATRAAYARDELIPKRTRLMRDWAKFCAVVQKPAAVTPIGRSRA